MGYLLIGVAAGFIVNRYIFPILDMLLDQLQYKITKVCTAIQIDTNLMSLEFEELVNSRNELTPAIGFVAGGSQDEYEDYDDDDEENKAKIGF
jgi:hypothetical protein